MPFTSKLFQALQDGSLQSLDVVLDVIKNPKPSQPNTDSEMADMKSLLPNEDTCSTSTNPLSDPEDRENSDDDDRNHKHRKRDACLSSFDKDCLEQPTRRPNRKSNAYDNGQLFMDTGLQSHEFHKEFNSTPNKGITFKLDKQHFGLSQSVHPSVDLSSRSRLNPPFHADGGFRPDSSYSLGRVSIGRGRGRSSTSWSQLDSRFSSLDSLDFASHMASQGTAHPGLFMGPGLPCVGTSPNASWGAFGFIHGMSSGIMDPLHPLSMHAALRPAMNPSLNLGMPRQRCRDFEERGFFLRGDMCPMEHGVNRIVVEDVQDILMRKTIGGG